MPIRSLSSALLAACVCAFSGPSALAQSNAPTIRSFSVAQVPELTPGTELIFRAEGTPKGVLSLRIDGATNLVGLPETRPGSYEAAYTISIRDKITYESKVNATLRVGQRLDTVTLGQTLLTTDAHARLVAAASPPPAIERLETKNSGALTGGHEIDFALSGTPGGTASVSLDSGKTIIPLAEEKDGQYTGRYTVKSRDRLSDTTQVSATLALGERKATAVKPLAPGVLVPRTAVAAAVAAKCAACGVVQAVNKVDLKGTPNYVGAIAGGVAGAALGNQVGKGDGRTAATLLGAVGGAVAGREVEKRVRANTVYDVVVKLDDATTRTVRYESEPTFQVGSKVRFSGEALVANE